MIKAKYDLTGQTFGPFYVDSYAGKGSDGVYMFNGVFFIGPYIGIWVTVPGCELVSGRFIPDFEAGNYITLAQPHVVVRHDYEAWFSHRMSPEGIKEAENKVLMALLGLYRICSGCSSQTGKSDVCEHCGCSGD